MGQQSGAASYVRVLRERWWIIVASALVCVVTGLVSQTFLPTTYSTESDLLISPIDNGDSTFVGVDVFRNISSDPTPNVLTLARYAQTLATAQLAVDQLDVTTSPQGLLSHVSVRPLSQTNIVAIDAKAGSAVEAASIANAFADATVKRRTRDVQADVRAVIARLTQQVPLGWSLRGGRPADSAASVGAPFPRRASRSDRVGSATAQTCQPSRRERRRRSSDWPRSSRVFCSGSVSPSSLMRSRERSGARRTFAA